jgi:hypothetical protein
VTADAQQQIADKLLSIRMTKHQKGLVEERAELEALAASTWARDALLMLAAGELSLKDIEIAVQEARSRRAAPAVEPETRQVLVRGAHTGLGRREVLAGGCLHPLHLRERLPFFDRCQCGKRFRR